MSRDARLLVWVAVAILVPAVPFLVAGSAIEERLTAWLDAEHSRSLMFAVTVLVLSTDVFLPIPSSFVSTLAGARLGVAAGTLASWTGMTLGAAGGFALARWAGPRLERRFSRSADAEDVAGLREQWGPGLLVLTRPLPLLAEATVLFVGLSGLSWPRFLLPVVLSNLGLALGWSALGEWSRRRAWLPAALAVSIALPVLIAAAVRLRQRRRSPP